jgi:hypothetical protein
MPQRSLKALLVTVALVAPLAAQRGGHGGFQPRATPSRAFASSFGRRSPYGAGFYLGAPFWLDDYSPQYPQTPVIVIPQQADAPSRAFSTSEEPKPAAPLMIEWDGDQYVRRSSDGVTTASVRPSDSIKPSAAPPLHAGLAAPTAPGPEPPPAIFVFRDGHREESSDYSIISGIIYSSGNYWTTGSWSRKIPISDLDVPATLAANREHGVPFRLPSAPNEIITRP